MNLARPTKNMECFGPIVDKTTEVLILGSFPGIASLQKKQYYGHPKNLFWKLVGDVINEDLVSIPYSKRLTTLKKHKIGLWDVIQTCSREGSLDSNIKSEQQNQFELLKKKAPKLKQIFFNGKKAGSYQKMLEELGYVTTILPSTSPANAGVSIEVKRVEWGKISPNSSK